MSNGDISVTLEKILQYLKALTIIQTQMYISSDLESKPELLLASSGLTYQEIGELVGKTKAAVGMTISRANK